MHTFIKIVDRLNDSLGRNFAWLALLMVLVMGLIVALRYLFLIGSIALQESVMYLNALIFTMGAAYTLKEQGHVRVDVFYNRCNKRTQTLIDMVGSLLFLVVSCSFIIWASWDYVSISWRIREGSAESSGLPFVYLLKTSIVILPTLLILQGLSEFLKALNAFRAQGDDT